MRIEFDAWEYHADATFLPARYCFDGSTEQGWEVTRNGQCGLRLGAGYRPLRTLWCGVCSTDLSRHHLPFPLPQVTGHEAVVCDEHGRTYVVEINASHHARGVDHECCPFCRVGLDTHCPDRLVLGIHDLPGGFGPHLLAPVNAAVALPLAVDPRHAVIVEPFAAALHAVRSLECRPGDRIAVLGPRKLGMLVVAALAAARRREVTDFTIVALGRRQAPLDVAQRLGADVTHRLDGRPPAIDADIVIDTTGSPEGLDLAIQMARREVHLKSTHGLPASGLANLTALVVDEIGLARLPPTREAWDELVRPLRPIRTPPVVAWLASSRPPQWLDSTTRVVGGSDVRSVQRRLEATLPAPQIRQADVAVVDTLGDVDLAIRPSPEKETGLVRPRGLILIDPRGSMGDSRLLQAIAERNLRLSSTRCGRFDAALAWLAEDATLRAIADRLVTHVLSAQQLPEAFDAARSPECIKAVVRHAD